MKLGALASQLFSLEGRVAVITGGAGLLGRKHAAIIADAGGIPVLADVNAGAAETAAREIGGRACGIATDITRRESVEELLATVIERFGRVDILINNAAIDPKVGGNRPAAFSHVESLSMEQWDAEMDVGLKGAFICAQVIGTELARRGGGVIVNIGSEYGVNGPDQRLYRIPGLPEEQQPVKPITYTVVKSGLLGMNRYLAIYWGPNGVRVNAVSLAGVRQDQSEDFIRRYTDQVPLGRMAEPDDYQGTILYLCSDASKFLTGVNLIIDGGKSCW